MEFSQFIRKRYYLDAFFTPLSNLILSRRNLKCVDIALMNEVRWGRYGIQSLGENTLDAGFE
jgi:hypothetical protein